MLRLALVPRSFVLGDAQTTGSLTDAVESLVNVYAAMGDNWLRVASPLETIESLERAGALPLFDYLSRLFTEREVEGPDPRDVERIMLELLARCDHLESSLGVTFCLVECAVTPAVSEESNPTDIDHVTNSAYGMLAIASAIGYWTDPVVIIPEVKSVLNSVRCSPRAVEPENSQWIAREFSSQVRTVPDFRTFLMTQDPASLLFKKPKLSSAILNVAIGLASDQYAIGVEEVEIEFANTFFESVIERHATDDLTLLKKMLRALAELKTGSRKSKSHALRVNKGGNSPQVRDGDRLAFRHDVDHEYHIHYWKGPGVIEIAGLVVHNEFQIAASPS